MITNFFVWFGELGLFFARMIRSAFLPPFEIRELIRQMDEIGSKSAPLMALAGSALGVVLSMQLRDALIRFGGRIIAARRHRALDH